MNSWRRNSWGFLMTSRLPTGAYRLEILGVKYLAVMLLTIVVGAAQTKVPSLADLKVAAERGDALAQYAYGNRIQSSNPADSFAMILKSADQGYGPAEDAVGQHYKTFAPINKPKDGGKMERLAVRYTSRAAFKGIPRSQERLSSFYERGAGLPRNPTLAYGWLAIAAKTAVGPIYSTTFKSQLDHLIAKTSSDIIVAGQKFADAFQPMPAGFNPVEADILVAQMKVNAFYVADGKPGVLVNQARFVEGETKVLKFDDIPTEVTCVLIRGKNVTMRIGPYGFTLTGK